MPYIVDFILHIDRHLAEIIADFGFWTYVILFLIIFCETGLVVTPFLPGDSLLFAAGALCVTTVLDVQLLWVVLFIAAILGDATNYQIGRHIGPRVFSIKSRFIKHEHLVRTQEFFENHGGKTIVMARFIPIIRTFAPFVAGVGQMRYRRFGAFNIVGGFIWVTLFLYVGYFFGNLPFVKENFSLVILAIIILSLVPIMIEYFRNRSAKRGAADGG